MFCSCPVNPERRGAASAHRKKRTVSVKYVLTIVTLMVIYLAWIRNRPGGGRFASILALSAGGYEMVKTNAAPARSAGRAGTRAPDPIRYRPGTRMARKLVGSRKNRAAFLELLARSGDPAVAATALGLPLMVLLRHRDDDPGFAAEWTAAVNHAWELLESRMLGALLQQSSEAAGAIDTRLALAIVGRRDKPAHGVAARPVDSTGVARLRAELRKLAGEMPTRQ
jgi:hypothetical protein